MPKNLFGNDNKKEYLAVKEKLQSLVNQIDEIEKVDSALLDDGDYEEAYEEHTDEEENLISNNNKKTKLKKSSETESQTSSDSNKDSIEFSSDDENKEEEKNNEEIKLENLEDENPNIKAKKNPEEINEENNKSNNSIKQNNWDNYSNLQNADNSTLREVRNKLKATISKINQNIGLNSADRDKKILEEYNGQELQNIKTRLENIQRRSHFRSLLDLKNSIEVKISNIRREITSENTSENSKEEEKKNKTTKEEENKNIENEVERKNKKPLKQKDYEAELKFLERIQAGINNLQNKKTDTQENPIEKFESSNEQIEKAKQMLYADLCCVFPKFQFENIKELECKQLDIQDMPIEDIRKKIDTHYLPLINVLEQKLDAARYSNAEYTALEAMQSSFPKQYKSLTEWKYNLYCCREELLQRYQLDFPNEDLPSKYIDLDDDNKDIEKNLAYYEDDIAKTALEKKINQINAIINKINDTQVKMKELNLQPPSEHLIHGQIINITQDEYNHFLGITNTNENEEEDKYKNVNEAEQKLRDPFVNATILQTQDKVKNTFETNKFAFDGDKISCILNIIPDHGKEIKVATKRTELKGILCHSIETPVLNIDNQKCNFAENNLSEEIIDKSTKVKLPSIENITFAVTAIRNFHNDPLFNPGKKIILNSDRLSGHNLYAMALYCEYKNKGSASYDAPYRYEIIGSKAAEINNKINKKSRFGAKTLDKQIKALENVMSENKIGETANLNKAKVRELEKGIEKHFPSMRH